MIHRIIDFSLKNRTLVVILTLTLIVSGAVAFKSLPIEAYPDIADTWVQVISQWQGHAAEEVERQITVPIEIVMNGVPHHTHLRSVSLSGLSVVTLIFDEKTTPFIARQYVMEKLPGASLPAGVQASLAPMSSPVGELYWYILDSKTRSPMELKEIEDWEMEKRWKEIPGVADVSSFGGMVKQYQVLANPTAMASYGLTPSNVVQAVSGNNQNSGGGFLFRGEQAVNVRGIGTAKTTRDLENIIIKQQSGTPVRVRNIGQVVIGAQPRLGQVSMSERLPDGTIDDRDEVVWGKVLSRTGEVDERVLDRIHEKAKIIQSKYLPRDVKLKPYIDRSKLIHLTTATVEENLCLGMLLVVVILLFFLGNGRSALIVAATIPLSLLIASIFLDLRNIPANLLSLGALDFGMIVDGAVVMIENIYRHKKRETASSIHETILAAAREVERPIVYAIAIIILAYLPIFTLQRIEGRLFSPMAWTVAFALMGSLLLVLTVVPVLASYFMSGELKEWHNPVMPWIEGHYRKALVWALARKQVVIGVCLASFALTLYLAFGGPIGSEFLPHLDEGNIWLRGTLPPSTSFETASGLVRQTRKILMAFPEVPLVVCQVGRPDDGTDATGFFNTECFVDLLPHAKWRRRFTDKEQLIAAMNGDLNLLPGVVWNFSQPISDNVEEMMSGVKGEMVAKLYGDDLATLDGKAKEIKEVLSKVRGIEDLGVVEVLGQPNLNIRIDRDKISRYGLNVSDVQDTIETAVGGKAASQMVDGEKRFDIVVRYQPQYRSRIDQIHRLMLTTPDGSRIPLEEVADIRLENGASLIYREGNSRFVAVKFSVRGRDLGTTIEEAQAAVKKQVLIPAGYEVKWSGEFESQQRAEARLAIVIPLTVLAICFLLYFMFRSLKWTLIILADVLSARIGGVLALYLTGTSFSVSSGIGFLAVFGVSIQTGVLLLSYINQMRSRGFTIREAVVEGSCRRLRPIIMTALVATFGLLPAAFSHGIGSDSQRPLAIVIVGGLLADLVLAFFILPTLYDWFADENDILR